jgi:hypothetical protein
MQNNPLTTASETYANSAPVPAFNIVHRPDRTAERAQYIRYHADNLARCIVEGKPASDVAHYADHLAKLVMEARAGVA